LPFVSFGNNADIVVHYDNSPFWISADTNKVTLNDLECPIPLKVCLADGTLNVYVCCYFQSWQCVTGWTWTLTVKDKNVAN